MIQAASHALTHYRPRNLPLPNGAETFTGDLTYYGPGLGACGVTSTEKDDIVSISHFTFDAVQKGSDPNQNPLCGRKIRAQRVNNGKTVSVDLTVVDRCQWQLRGFDLIPPPLTTSCICSNANLFYSGTGCQPTDIDVSPTVFDKLADHDLGRVPVTWAWL